MLFSATFASGVLALLPSTIAAPANDPSSSVTEITVRADQKHQKIEGFGFSGAFQRAQLLLNVTEEKQHELVELLYSTETGVGFSMLRNGIGSSNSSYNDWMNPGALQALP